MNPRPFASAEAKGRLCYAFIRCRILDFRRWPVEKGRYNEE